MPQLGKCSLTSVWEAATLDCDDHKPRKTLLLVDVLAKIVREVRQLAISEHWKAPPPWWREIDAVLIRHQQES